MNIFYARYASFIRYLDRILGFAAFGAFVTSVLEGGFFLSRNSLGFVYIFDIIFAGIFIFAFLGKVFSCRKKSFYLMDRWWETLILVLWIITPFVVLFVKFHFVVFGIRFQSSDVFHLIRNGFKLYLVITGLFHGLAWLIESFMSLSKKYRLRFHPAQVSLAGFLGVIIIGALLLMMPKSTAPGVKISFLNALFTSTSSVCVTGLAVLDTGSEFTRLGQAVILGLIQFGGLGVITVALFFRTFFSTGVGIQDRVLLQDILSTDGIEQIVVLMRKIILVVLGIELAGTVALSMLWMYGPVVVPDLWFSALFHSVSAFCNAGFSLFSDSLTRFAGNVPVMIVFSLLIILGGLGFTALLEIGSLNPFRKIHEKKPVLKVQTRIVLLTSAILLVAGFLVFVLLEKDHYQGADLFLAAFFSSVTARTAGFNTIEFGSLSVPVTLFFMLLMFIGASPGSTGGGIKTTTVAVLWTSVFRQISSKRRMVVFRKYIPPMVTSRAMIVLWFAFIVVFGSTFLLSITESKEFLDVFFEAVSAFATVGLSRGITAELTAMGKVILIVTMYIGRLGILPLAFAITTGGEPLIKVRYPSENINVG